MASTEARDRVFSLLVLPYGVLFLGFVGVGWYLGLATSYQMSFGQAVLAATAIALTVGVLARFAGAYKYAASIGRMARWPARVVFVVMLVLSAIGLLSSIMLLKEGPAIVRAEAERAARQVTSFKARLPEVLKSEEFERLRGEVNSLKAQLDQEIRNYAGGLCGVGPRAKSTLAEIGRLIPAVRVISGTDGKVLCQERTRVENIARIYQDLVDNALANSEMAQKTNMAGRVAFGQTALRELDTLGRDLVQVQNTLAPMSSFVLNLDAYHASMASLRRSRQSYDDLVAQLGVLLGFQPVGLRGRIELGNAERLTDVAQLPDVIVDRLKQDHATMIRTGLFVAGAFAADWLMVFLVFVAFRHRLSSEYGRERLANYVDLDGSRARYLWTPAR